MLSRTGTGCFLSSMFNKFKVRVIYRDTDAEGVVYYANYLAWFEQGRSEFLRQAGMTLKQLKDDHNIVYVIKSAKVEYVSPAVYDDELRIETRISKIDGIRLEFEQKAFRTADDQALVEGFFIAVAMNADTLKPAKLPLSLKDKLKELV